MLAMEGGESTARNRSFALLFIAGPTDKSKGYLFIPRTNPRDKCRTILLSKKLGCHRRQESRRTVSKSGNGRKAIRL